jgi:hypothetical protein
VKSSDLHAHLVRQGQEALEVLAALNDTLTWIDNGYCAICRVGYHSYTKGRVGYNCSNDDCVSHRVAKVLGLKQ